MMIQSSAAGGVSRKRELSKPTENKPLPKEPSRKSTYERYETAENKNESNYEQSYNKILEKDGK